ncbi:hypothetical protein ACFQ88_05710 [Paenibacillus sp. NPDC056579]|uniref:hypothetical protein n=1 Tax=Paenibacillus sp. NPDC056579 TaxID=3345871 RepID=UPI00368BD811
MIARSFAFVSGKLNLPGSSQSLATFADRESISAWAQSAVAGSVEAGIIAGWTADVSSRSSLQPWPKQQRC